MTTSYKHTSAHADKGNLRAFCRLARDRHLTLKLVHPAHEAAIATIAGVICP